MDVKLANTADYRQASDQLTQIRAAGIIKLDIIKLKILYIDVESVQQFSYSAQDQVPGPAYLNVGVKFEVGLKIIPIISGPGVFDPKLRRTDALICALDTWIVLGSDKTKL